MSKPINTVPNVHDNGDGTHEWYVRTVGGGNGLTGLVALTSPPASTNAGSETVLTFDSQAQSVLIQNNTTEDINASFDSTATLGSYLIPAGQERNINAPVTALHLYTVSAQTLNQTTAGGIVVIGWA